MLRKICPCLKWFSGGSRSDRKGYNPERELEEEEFMHQIEAEGKRFEDSNKLMDDDITPIEERLEKELHGSEEERELAEAETKRNQQIESYFRETLTETPKQPEPSEEKGESHQLLQLQEAKPEDEEEKGYGELLINLAEDDPHYALLIECAYEAANKLDTSIDCVEMPVNSLAGKSGSKLKINKAKLRAWRKAQEPTCFVIEYILPCSFSFYSELINKKVQPKDKHKLINEYKLVESLHPNLSLKYLEFLKIGMLEPREFHYYKYTNNSQVSSTGHWELCISKDSAGQGEQKTGRLYSVTYIKQGAANGEVCVKVRSFINLTINTSWQKIWEKIFMECKAYIEDLWEEAAENYEEELV